MRTITIILAAFLLTSVPAFGQYTWFQNPDDGHWYALTLSSDSWVSAESQALALGGHLATVRDSVNNQWLTDTFAPTGTARWIGLTDQASEGTWVWSSGEAVTFTNWASGEPGSAAADYALLHGGGAIPRSQWNADGPPDLYLGIIELENDPPPPPAFVLQQPAPGIAEAVNVFTVTGATPGRNAWLMWGTRTGRSPAPECPGLEVGMAFAKVGGVTVADPSATATFTRYVPAKAYGRFLLFQAVDTATFRISNLVGYQFP